MDIYRAGGAEVFVVRGPRGELDVPGVKGIVIDLAPDRGEMIVDMDALALDARPVDDEEYIRPRDRRPPNPKRPKTPKATATEPAVKAPKSRPAASATRSGGTRPDTGTRPLTADEIATLRGTPVAPDPGDAEPPSDAG